ncbi:11002_t:CDS:2, partial [Funneliformis geosporum]
NKTTTPEQQIYPPERNKEDAKEKEDQSIFLQESEESVVNLPQKQIDITPKRKLDDVEEDDDIYDNFEIVISDIILIVRKTDVRVKMEEWRKKSDYISEIHKQ